MQAAKALMSLHIEDVLLDGISSEIYCTDPFFSAYNYRVVMGAFIILLNCCFSLDSLNSYPVRIFWS